MTVLDTLITDRTVDDVKNARTMYEKGYINLFDDERAAWDAGLKGAYDYRDMNCVREAIEYVDSLAVAAKRDSAYVPVIIPHKTPKTFDADGMVTQWEQWSDKVWIDYDLPTPAQWAAHLQNINNLWAVARRFVAVVLPRYDPDKNGYIKPGTAVTAGALFRVLDSVGLLELRVVCAGSSITAAGTGWAVTQTDAGWTARLDYANCPWPDVGDALAALSIVSTADSVVDGSFTLEATLRYNHDVTAGTCLVRWSPFITWGEALDLYQTWGGTKGLTWDLAARGRKWPRVGQGWFTINYDADYKKE